MNALACILFGGFGLIALLALGHSAFVEGWPVNSYVLFPGVPTWGVVVMSLLAFLLSAWFARRHRKEQEAA